MVVTVVDSAILVIVFMLIKNKKLSLMKKTSLLTATILLSACTASTDGIRQTPNGTLKITYTGDSGAVSTNSLLNKAKQDALSYCKKQGKQVVYNDMSTADARPFGGWPEGTVEFNCN